MKTGTEYFTNLSDGESFVIISYSGKTVDDWIKAHPGETAGQGSFALLLSHRILESRDSYYDLFDDDLFDDPYSAFTGGFVNSCIRFLDGTYDAQLIDFLKKNKKQIEAESNGEIIAGCYDHAESMLNVEMIRLSGGKERRADFGDARIEPETYETVDIDFDDYDCDSSEKVRNILSKLAPCWAVTFSASGKLRKYASIEELEHYIECTGGSFQSAVSTDTDYLITNDTNPASKKVAKANGLGIKIITEEQFIDRFGGVTVEPMDDEDDFDEEDYY